MRARFARFAAGIAATAGSPWAFLIALATVAAWAVSGPLFGFSDFWLLLINTLTTIVTFLMVFVIQASANADTREIKVLLHALAEDIAEVDEVAVAEQLAQEER